MPNESYRFKDIGNTYCSTNFTEKCSVSVKSNIVFSLLSPYNNYYTTIEKRFKNMNYQLIAIDVDGTLTNSEKIITPATKKALIELQERGKHVVISTGRPPTGIDHIAKELDIERFNGHIISYNGGQIYNARTKEVLFKQTLDSKYIQLIYDFIKGRDLNIVAYWGNEIISAFKPNPQSLRSAKNNQMPIRQVDNFVDFFTGPLYKLLIVGNIEVVNPTLEELITTFGDSLGLCTSHPEFIEVTPPNVDKGASLQFLLNHLNLTTDETIACGDGSNDITMLQCAGLGVAMANAHPDALAIADYITTSNDDEGVLRVVKKFM